MRISDNQYMNNTICPEDLDNFRQCELSSHPDKIVAFLPEKYCFPGSYIKFRKTEDDEWSPPFRINRISKIITEEALARTDYYKIPDDSNIAFVKKQYCRTDSKGIIICEPRT